MPQPRIGIGKFHGHDDADDAERLVEGQVGAAGDRDLPAEEPLRGSRSSSVRQSRTLPASQRALPSVWPALRTSSSASSSTWASTTAANRRSTAARSPGATARHVANASCAASIAAVGVLGRGQRDLGEAAGAVAGSIDRVELLGHAHNLSKPRRSSQSVTAASNARSSTSAMFV